jgi:hypothetical protein
MLGRVRVVQWAVAIAAVSLSSAVTSADADDEGLSSPPRIATQVRVPYPYDLAFDIASLSCKVNLEITPEGAVDSVSNASCLPQLFEHSESYVRQFTFHPATQAGEPVPSSFLLTIVYKLEPDGRPRISGRQFQVLMRAHGPLTSDRAGCHMAATVHPSGAITALQSNDFPACMAVPALVEPPTRLSDAATGDVRCTLEANARKGSASGVRFVACPKDYRRTARVLMSRWRWNSWGLGGAGYFIELTFAKDEPPS